MAWGEPDRPPSHGCRARNPDGQTVPGSRS
jgi:hypothetical protein